MTKFKFLRRFISTLSASMLMLGMLTFVPGAFAATVKFSPEPPAVFNYIKDSSIKFNVGMTDSQNAVLVNFKLKGPFDGQNVTTKLIDSKLYNGNVLMSFNWDGKINGVFVPSGQYQASFEGADNVLTWDFWVVSAEPTLSFDPTPASTYVIGSGDMLFPVKLSGFKSPTEVLFSLVKKGKNNPMVDAHTYTGNNTFEYLWNGKINQADPEPGTYVATFSGKDKDGNPTNEKVHEFEIVSKSSAVLSYDPAVVDEYVMGSGNYKPSVVINGFNSDTLVTVAVEDPDSALLVPRDNFTYTFNKQSHQFNVDLSSFPAGTYKVEISGVDKDNLNTNTLAYNLSVVKADNTCAGYQDVNKNSSSCEALTWLKKEGIMEGEGNGTLFNPNGDFNRAASAKVALVAYDKYNANVDYCNGKNPFPDTDKDEWYGNYICRAVTLGVVTGYTGNSPDAGNFVPGRAVSVIEMFALLLRPLNENFVSCPSYTGLENNVWYSPYACYSKKNAYYPGNTLSPTKVASRLEVADYLYELHLDGKI